mmetsp:Transcript_22962/g.35425  ORF Transcript_22962/g.35425 Transcript_22962/m.35425 type:complete len:188 (+) Transcript_22962:1883-2446(+)
MEYYTNISCSIEQDSYFDLMISNAWNLNGNNPMSMPYAGSQRKIAQVNAREAYRQDHHRNLFGTDNSTPWQKTKRHQGEQWVSTTQSAMQGGETSSGQNAAGTNTFFNPEGYKNQFGSSRDAAVGYTGTKHTHEELVQQLRDKLATRGARGIIGLQRVFKILDDNNSKSLDQQEFYKALDQYRLRIS